MAKRAIGDVWAAEQSCAAGSACAKASKAAARAKRGGNRAAREPDAAKAMPAGTGKSNPARLDRRPVGALHFAQLSAAATALLCAVCPATSAGAAEASVASDIEEVVVTARRREEPLAHIPLSVTVLNEQAIRARGITELNQVEKFAPNIVQTNFGQGNTGHAAVFMRGIGLQDHIITTDPAVGIYLDGVYLGRNMGANMDLLNIDHVEVVRGPQGSLHGRNTLGGALNIVTRKPVGEDAGRIDVKVGSLGRRNGNFFADIALADALALTVSGGVKSRGGVGRALGIANPEAEIGEILQGFGRAALLWEANHRWRVLATADVSRSDQGVTPHAVRVFNPDNGFGLRQSDQPANPDDTHSLNNELMSTADETKGFSLTVDWHLTDGVAARAIVSGRSMWFEGGLDNEKVAATLIEFPERGEADQVAVEALLRGETAWGDWLAGLYAFNEDGFNRSPFVFRPGGVGDGRPAVIPASDFDGLLLLRQKAQSRAAFAHANVEFRPHWTLGVGIRHTRDAKDGTGFLHYFPEPARRSDEWSAWTGDLSLAWQLADNVNVFARYARGYQAGGYPPRPFGGPDTFAAFDHTTADSFEIGAKGALGERWTLRAALFHVGYGDLVVQVSELIGQGFLTLTQNAAESKATGIEIEGAWAMGDDISVAFAFGYMDIEISKVDERVQGIEVSDSPALTPNFTLSLSPRKRWRLPGGGAVTARIDHYRRGPMFGQPVNTPLNRIDSLALTSGSLAYTGPDGGWEVALYGHNLTDEIYPLAKLDLDPTVLIINSNDRREYGLRLSKTFGR